jgi:biotin carboxylase
LIRKANAMGFETIVVSPHGNYPGLPLADRVWGLDTTDVPSILSAARGEKLAGVVTTGTDVCLPALGALVDELKLVGPSASSADLSSNKVMMKQQFMKYGVPTARFQVVETLDGAFAAVRKIGFPVMVKATDSSGSRGISKAKDEESLPLAWEAAKKVSRNGLILVEEYLDGLEFGAQAFVRNKKMQLVLAHNDQVTGPPFQTPIGHSMPARLAHSELSRMEQVSEMALEALGITDAICNMDFMLHAGEVKVLEIGARMGATCLPENISVYAGSDIYEYMIQLATGEDSDFKVLGAYPNASILLMAQTAGICKSFHIGERVQKSTNLVEIVLDIAPGQKVQQFRVGPDRIGHIVAVGENAVNAENIVQEISENVIIEIE